MATSSTRPSDVPLPASVRGPPAQRGWISKVAYHVGRGGTLLVHLLGRAEGAGRIDRRITGCEPYFYGPVEESEKGKALPEVVNVSEGPPDIYGRLMSRIQLQYPFQTPIVRDQFSRTCESRVIFSTRVRVDHGLNFVGLPEGSETLPLSQVTSLDASQVSVQPRMVFLDIEVDDKNGFPKAEEAKEQIRSISIVDDGKINDDGTIGQIGVIHNCSGDVTPEQVLERLRQQWPEHAIPKIPIRIIKVRTEREILGRLADLLRKRIDPDVVVAYNGDSFKDKTKGFDYPYLWRRAEFYMHQDERARLPEDPMMRLIRDSFHQGDRRSRGRFACADMLIALLKQDLNLPSYRLQAVMMEWLGYGKLTRKYGITEGCEKDPVELVAYNAADSIGMWQLEQKAHFIGYLIEKANVVGVEIEDTYFDGRVWYAALLKTARSEGGRPTVCLPSDPPPEPPEEKKAQGGAVFDPVIGTHFWVPCWDLKREYPSVEKTWNISPECQRPEAIPGLTYDLPWGSHYAKNPMGITTRALFMLDELRDRYQKKATEFPLGSRDREIWESRSTAVKFSANSSAGVLREKHFPLLNRQMFEDITGIARANLNWNRTKIEDRAWLAVAIASVVGPERAARFTAKGLAGDTDSCFCSLMENGQVVTDLEMMVKVSQAVRKALNASYRDFSRSMGGPDEHYLSVKLEYVWESIRLLPKAKSRAKDGEKGAKKNYYGLVAWNDKDGDIRAQSFEKRFVYKGIALRRSNVAEITHIAQREVIERVLTGREKEVKDWVGKLRVEVFDGKRDDQLMVHGKLSADLEASEEDGGYARTSTIVDEETGETTTKERTLPAWVQAIENSAKVLGVQAKPGEGFKWAKVRGDVSFGEQTLSPSLDSKGRPKALYFAFPDTDTIEEWKARGLQMEIDRDWAWKKSAIDPIKIIFPEFGGSQQVLEGWED